MSNIDDVENAQTGTRKFINTLMTLKEGDLGLLRSHSYKQINSSIQAFDLFTGIWWNLRKNNQWAPKRDVSWLIAKLFAQFPLPHKENYFIAAQLAKCNPNKGYERFQLKFDSMLMVPFEDLEAFLQWAFLMIHKKSKQIGTMPIDWVQLTNDLSHWNSEKIKTKWAIQFIHINKGE